MTQIDLKENKVELLAFSRLNGNVFTVAECILIHQWTQQGVNISSTLMLKMVEVLKLIKSSRWEVPRLHYNGDRHLCTRDADGNERILIKN